MRPSDWERKERPGRNDAGGDVAWKPGLPMAMTIWPAGGRRNRRGRRKESR